MGQGQEDNNQHLVIMVLELETLGDDFVQGFLN